MSVFNLAQKRSFPPLCIVTSRKGDNKTEMYLVALLQTTTIFSSCLKIRRFSGIRVRRTGIRRTRGTVYFWADFCPVRVKLKIKLFKKMIDILFL
jgi:hypothetical protein